jgi:hypothetical protein
VHGWNGDTGISRDSAGVVDVGNGTAGNASGTLKATTGTFSGAVTGTTITPVYNVSGTLQASSHTVRGTSAAMSGGAVTVTLSGAAVFTNSSSYTCTANENVSGVIYQPIGITYTSGSSITFNNDSSDTATVSFICTGN